MLKARQAHSVDAALVGDTRKCCPSMIAIAADIAIEQVVRAVASSGVTPRTRQPHRLDNVVLYGQYILDRKLVRQRGRAMRAALSLDLIPKAFELTQKVNCTVWRVRPAMWCDWIIAAFRPC